MNPRRLGGIPLLVIAALLPLAACAAEPPASAVPSSGTPTTPHPTSTSSASPTPSPSATPRLRVVTLGDSLMSGFGLNLGQAWPTLLAKEEHLTLTNLACGGMGFVVAGDCGTPYSGLIPAVAALQPQVVIVQSSSNDFGEDPDEVRAATIATIDQMHQAAPDAQIVGLSTIWNDDSDLPDEVASTSGDLQEAITLIGGTFVDVGQPLAGHPRWMQDDDVHPTARGQEAIARVIREKLPPLGEPT